MVTPQSKTKKAGAMWIGSDRKPGWSIQLEKIRSHVGVIFSHDIPSTHLMVYLKNSIWPSGSPFA